VLRGKDAMGGNSEVPELPRESVLLQEQQYHGRFLRFTPTKAVFMSQLSQGNVGFEDTKHHGSVLEVHYRQRLLSDSTLTLGGGGGHDGLGGDVPHSVAYEEEEEFNTCGS
jgi:hypothetical protein